MNERPLSAEEEANYRRAHGGPHKPSCVACALLATLDAARATPETSGPVTDRAQSTVVTDRALWAKPWLVRLTCCGRADGVYAADTRDEAEAFREVYTTGPGVGGTHIGNTGHVRTAVIEDALTAAPEPVPGEEGHGEGLDVERLGIAVEEHVGNLPAHECNGDCAAEFAAVYARLTPTPEETPRA